MIGTASPSASSGQIRVMVVDDSVVIRGFLTRFIESGPGLKVVASAYNGQMALEIMAQIALDVIVLDIEMPVMPGLTALPLILKKDPDVQVIMASTLTQANAAITFKCLEMGAAECLAKPTAAELGGASAFREDLVNKVRELGELAHRRRGGISGIRRKNTPLPPVPQRIQLRPEMPRFVPDVIAIGSSTGGPQSLMQFFGSLKGSFRQPIFITQHMPPTFTTMLAEHIAKQSGYPCCEAAEGGTVTRGTIYVAPGNYHMTIKNAGSEKVISLNQAPPENFCRPSVDPMLRSLMLAYGPKILAVIFTGMGTDGLKGCQEIVNKGGVVIAQDEATSVVWGMPGAVAKAGICTRVLPLGQMADAVREYMGS
jgi:two-component system chemotaxis response regulator CheB